MLNCIIELLKICVSAATGHQWEGKIRKDFSKAYEIGGGICERLPLVVCCDSHLCV